MHNHDYLASLGVVKAVDYHDASWPDQILGWMPTGVAGALAIQPNTTSSSIAVVRNGGTVVTISGDQVARPPRGVVVAGLPYHVDVSGELADLVRQICSRQIHLEIEKIYAFDDAIAALNKVQTRHARGKIVLSFE